MERLDLALAKDAVRQGVARPSTDAPRPGKWIEQPEPPSPHGRIARKTQCGPARQTCPPPQDALRPGSVTVATGNAGWGLAKDAVRPGCQSAGTPTLETAWGSIRESERNAVRQRAAPPASSPMGTASVVATVSVRPVVAVRPEHVEAAAPLPLSGGQQLLRMQGEAAGACQRSNRNVRVVRSWFPLRNLEPQGSGNPGCRAVSVSHLLDDRWCAVEWGTAVGMGCRALDRDAW